MKRLLSAAVLLGLVFTGCKKQDDPSNIIQQPNPQPNPQQPIDSYASLRFAFTPTMGGQPLVMRTKQYVNANGDTFTVSAHKYFVSNFTVTDSADHEYPLPPAYFLVDADSLRTVSIGGIVPGRFKKISFLMGVDSLRNVSGAQTGDLDPAGRARGMFWDWNTGYIMAKMEGSSPQSGAAGKLLAFHIGTFSGKNSALRRVSLALPSVISLTEGKTPTIQIQSELATWFGGSTPVNFATTNVVMSANADSKRIADNYANSFTITRIDP